MNGIFRLREPAEHDLERLWRWRNSERVRSAMKSDRPISEEEHRYWFGRLRSRPDCLFFIFEKGDHPLGIVQFTGVNRTDGTCSWGFYLGEEGLPRGTGTLLGYLGLSRVFEKEGIRKVTAEVLESNLASYRMHKKLGFHIEGCLRKHVWRNGKYEDVILLAIFKKDWEEWQSRNGTMTDREVLLR